MPGKRETKNIDREIEEEMFENLLKFDSDKRILAIKDVGGMGKSQLLERFYYRCRAVKPRIPVSLVALDQLEDNKPFSLIKKIKGDLENFRLTFPNFNQFHHFKVSGDYSKFIGSINLQNATLEGSHHNIFAGNIIREAGAVTINTATKALTPEQEKEAEEVCIRAFLEDLRIICSKKLISPDIPDQFVLLLDAYERCESKLREWFEKYLLERYFFVENGQNRLNRLILVIAGREIPDFAEQWPLDYEAIVESREGLSKWELRHIEEFLYTYGYPHGETEVQTFYNLIQMGYTPLDIIGLIEIREKRRRES